MQLDDDDAGETRIVSSRHSSCSSGPVRSWRCKDSLHANTRMGDDNSNAGEITTLITDDKRSMRICETDMTDLRFIMLLCVTLKMDSF